jgi:hypothetical protein
MTHADRYHRAGVYKYPFLVPTWAARAHLANFDRLKDLGGRLIPIAFGFGDDVERNKEIYIKAVKEYGYITNPQASEAIFIGYFFAMPGCFALEFGKLLEMYPSLLETSPGEIPIRSLMDEPLPGAMVMSFLSVSTNLSDSFSDILQQNTQARHNLESWSLGSREDFEFSSWDVKHAAHYRSSPELLPIILAISNKAVSWYVVVSCVVHIIQLNLRRWQETKPMVVSMHASTGSF